MNSTEHSASEPSLPAAHFANGALAMSSREIADLVGSRHDKVKQSIERLAERGVIVRPPLGDEHFPDALGRPRTEQVYQVGKRDSFVVVAQLSPEFTARLVDRWAELEGRVGAMPDFSNPAVAARAWADQFEARLVAERTKAEIGTRREATAMNTASQATKKAARLEIELDRAHSYATVKRMQMIYHGQAFNWRLLKQTAAEMGIASIDIYDANYGTVKAYHADVWREAYALDIPVDEVAA